ncbi:hypothetical protein CO057_02455 [Candidatus Uhrbacteria bacterium CG_4_9_14_0_2_um_filter_41_50]|uniref:Uncharacterized protein n=1 Tax=Candidatus Uhrbacteria bacterium CG_4_9_14_0_2_um_filter_41_50 TaxID=1975031 RepID=A0A2M8EP27_9BACT|nr:MAG: hypothetical protein COZ45_04310 [Candidatus Uhrbacteria bacterium CG_4_10_14_3_um_filter_41_21]PIZ54398.1 MAG: hypothetical protein COY24_03950 [Candidatus Uhrbacteria bacterium CG_4_10_14_0_2_um_filter_41_21]PJB84996.1 MAG: hypothetical protein CO086_00600 [Candidatus Uhrbacteria bacterium CG_4_9_14_0_8_um_filter_41_16]PJC24503.1 MAG: hypothetical protein CO057_02455 [Candidatus Uhrbacteria bacterium CG_4_9_14_0_2_um_filter_41_50]PJE74729.1 MAG: hypothetical protein COV03_03925 [Candi
MSEPFIFCFPLTEEDTGHLSMKDVATVFEKLGITAVPTTPVAMDKGVMSYQPRNSPNVAVVAFSYMDPHVSPERRVALFKLMQDRNVIALVLRSSKEEDRIIIGPALRAYANARLVSGSAPGQRSFFADPKNRPL